MLIKMPGATGEYGEVVISGGIPGTPQSIGMSYPTYTCGHCTCIVVMRADRLRPRQKCSYCGRMVCDKEICDPAKAGCTPMYSLSNDHFEGAGPAAARRAAAIMRGATTLAEVDQILGGPLNGQVLK